MGELQRPNKNRNIFSGRRDQVGWRRCRGEQDSEGRNGKLNGLWIDSTDDQKPLEEIGEIYSIESGYISDGAKKVAVKMPDTDRVEINGFKAGKNWKGTYDGSFPDDRIKWDGGKTWIRPKHDKMIEDLKQIKRNLQDRLSENQGGPSDNDNIATDKLEEDLARAKQEKDQLQTDLTRLQEESGPKDANIERLKTD